MVLASILTDLTDWLEDVSAEWWFLLVILGIAFFDSIIPIVPSETTVILGGVAAGAGDQNLLLVIAAGAAGAFLGDNMRLPHRPALQPAASSAAPSAGRRRERRLEWADDQIRKRGGLLLITARFIPGGRTVLTITCGLTHQPWAWFAGWVAIAAVIWATYAAVPRRHLRPDVRTTTVAFLLAFGAALSVTIIIEVVRHQRAKRAEAAPTASPETGRAVRLIRVP